MYICSMVYVYPYIKASNNYDIDLSMQSVLNADPKAELWTIGDRVTLADNIKHKKSLFHRGADVTDKILTFAKEIGGDFIYMNDDFFITKNFNPQRTLFNGKLEVNSAHAPHYQEACLNTKQFLEFNEFNILNFECHQPMLFNSEMLIDLFNAIEWQHHNHFIKSLYGNVYDIPAMPGTNLKLNDPKISMADRFLNDFGCFSIGEGFKVKTGVNYLNKLIAAAGLPPSAEY